MSRILRTADDAFEVGASSSMHAQVIAAHLRKANIAEDVVPGIASVSVKFTPNNIQQVLNLLETVEDIPHPECSQPKTITIPMSYGGDCGPDLEHVCAHLKISQAEFISIHGSAVHKVDMIGFTPGFTYISGLPESFDVPRRNAPKTHVPAGSIGISAARTGIYAMDGPGGWPIIGQTTMCLFDPTSIPPFRLEPGDYITFEQV